MPLSLRPAVMRDAALLYQWRHDEEVLRMSGSTDEVDMDDHLDWLETFLKNPKQSLLVAMLEERPVGVGRIAVHPLDYGIPSCRVSYSIDAPYRGKGYGKELVMKVVKEAQMMGYSTVTARIRRGNIKSVVCAMAAGVTSIEFF